jgi:Family of unknown function (DUF5687)
MAIFMQLLAILFNSIMILILLSHQWKSFWRSLSAGKGVAIQIFSGFIGLYLLSVAVILGFHLQSIIEKISPGTDIIVTFCGFIFYYFAIDIILRFLFQDLPVLSIKPYLIQRIRRSELIRFLNIRSLFNIFNLLPIIFFSPFILSAIGTKFGNITTAGFLTSIAFLTIASNYLIIYLKRKMVLNNWWLAGFFILCTAFGFADHFNLFSLSKISVLFFSVFLTHPWYCVFPIFLAMLAFTNNYRFLLGNLYLEDMEGKQKRKLGSSYTFLDRYGLTGELISLDLKLIWRNKRPRTMLLYSVIFIFYGFIFYKPDVFGKPSHFWSLLFGALFVTGLAVFNYGSFLFAWQSSYFEGLMSANLSLKSYLKAKCILMTGMSSALFLMSTIYGILDFRLIFIQLACYLYIIGVNIILLIYLATWNYKGMDLSKSSMMNYQSSGIVQWLFTLSLFVGPFLIYFGFYYLINPWAGIWALGIVGFGSLLLRDWWIGLIVKGFNRRKYLILRGFRENL